MTSQLQIGNRALRNDDFVTAVQCYLRALDEAPALLRFIGYNVAMARRKLGEHRFGRDNPSVAVCGADLARDASRAHTLCLAYEPFASVELIGSLQPDGGADVWEPVRESRFTRHTIACKGDEFVERALQLVAARQYDVVHLCKPRAPNLILGLFYKLIWGSRVLLDIDDDELAWIGADGPINLLSHLATRHGLPPLDALAGADWTRIAAGLVGHFDAITVANPALRARHGGTVVHHARDTQRYAQSDALRRSGRRLLKVGETTKVVLLCSTPRNPAALAETADAVRSLGRSDVVLVVAGALEDDQAKAGLQAQPGVDCRLLGDLPFETMSEVFAAADVHVQLQDLQAGRSRFRLPASVADALAAGLPTLTRLAPGVLDEALHGAVIDVTEAGLAPALRDALVSPLRPEQRREALAPVLASLIDLQPNAAVLSGLCGANASPAMALTPECARLIETLPLPQNLQNVLPALMISAARLPVETAAAASTTPAGPQATSPPRPLPPLRHLAPVRAAVQPAAAADIEIAWTRSSDYRPTATCGVAELLGVGIGLLTREGLAAAAASDLLIVRAFADLHGRLDDAPVRLRGEAGTEPLAPERSGPQPWPRRHCRWHLERSGILVADLWFVTDSTLRLRIEHLADDATESPPRVLRALQFVAGRELPRMVAEAPFALEGLRFVDLALVNPFFPLLLVVTAADGDWLDTVLLPFPSLCRGGAHHGELAAVGSLPGYMSNLEALSNSALSELAGWPEAPPHLAVGCIEVDLQGATGAEKLFSAPVKEWLAEVMHLGSMLGLPMGHATPVHPFLESACSIGLAENASATTRRRLDDRATHGALALTLSADCLPTISTLTSRRLRLPAGVAVTTGTWVVAQSATGRPRAVVSMPPLVESLLGLQAQGQALAFPLLRQRSAAAATDPLPAAESRAPLPLAIRYRDAVKEPTPALLQPLAPDHIGPLLRRQLSDAERGSAAVSLLLVWPADATDVAPLLESVARQTLAAAVEVVVVLARGQADEQSRVEALLAPLFPGRHRVLPTDAVSPSACLNRAAAQAGGRHFLLADARTVLHDPRTLEALVTLSLDPGVATAACVVLREVAYKKGTEVRFFSGGIFPRQLSFHSRPSLILDEPYTTSAFPLATYPVVGNSFRLALVSAAAWSRLGGLDAANFPGHRRDLDFSLRALRAGFTHLCTGIVTATDLTPGGAEEHADTHALSFMPLDRWEQVVSATSTIRDLEA